MIQGVVGAIRCFLVRVERLERQLADASESSSMCAVSVVDTLVSLDRSLQEEGVVEWLELVRLEPQEIEIALPIKEETVEELMLVPRERAEKRTADQVEHVPQIREETVDAVTWVLRERVQQRTAEQIEDAPQSPAEVVEAVTSVPRERVQQRTAEKIGEVQETASQDLRLQRTVEQAFVDRAEAGQIALRKRFEGMC